ncbi:MAG: hypothetical protein WDN04_04055 [Rhodospirillales bacterium]
MKSFALAAAMVMAASTGAMAQKPFNVSLDGFCNTFALTINAFEIYGQRTGCGYTVIDGGNAATVSHAKYNVTNDSNDGSEIFIWYFTPPKHKAGNWYLYESTGTSETEVNSGTYTQTHNAVKVGSGKDVTRAR